MRAKRLTSQQRQEIFHTLVTTQDSVANVRKSYQIVTEKYEITDAQLPRLKTKASKKSGRRSAKPCRPSVKMTRYQGISVYVLLRQFAQNVNGRSYSPMPMRVQPHIPTERLRQHLAMQNLLWRSLALHPAVVQTNHMMRMIADHAQIVGHQQNRHVIFLVDTADQLVKLLLILEVDARGWLIEQQQFRFRL